MDRMDQTELNGLIHKSQEQQIISQQSKRYSDHPPRWTLVVAQMAQDKRHDLAPHTLLFWTQKLKNFPDELICDALMLGRWGWFPSCDDVLEQIDKIRESQKKASDLKAGKFIPCDKCEEGWIRVFTGQTERGNLVDPKFGAMKRCECFVRWAQMVKAV